MTLPFDICRCDGVKKDGELISPCSSCRRVLEQEPSGPRTPWMSAPLKDGVCEYVVSIH
jgi:hypothetical protein